MFILKLGIKGFKIIEVFKLFLGKEKDGLKHI